LPDSPTAFTPDNREHYGEADTRAKLIDPALHDRGWTEEHIRREQTPGGIEIVDGAPRRPSQKHIDYVLRVKVSASTQPVAVAYVEAKREDEPPETGLQQVKDYATTAERLHVPFVYATNGHLFIEYNHLTGQTTAPKPITGFPTPSELRARYEAAMGFSLDSEEAQANFLLKHYPPDAFSHIIIDECHRSAWGKWFEVLKRNPNAIQIGLTATPRQLILSARKQQQLAELEAVPNALLREAFQGAM
jgi:type I site-specific restriction endonuclease